MGVETAPEMLGDEEDVADFNRHKTRIIRAIMDGRAVISSDSLTYTPSRSDDVGPITFYEPTGAAWLASDGKKKNHSIASLHAVQAQITRQPPVIFSKLRGADYKFCQSVAVIFLA